ncbi:MAG: Gx transporter family protein [Treponema sp.]|nr:Gx transporter family protein [Treponema sp.]
MKLTAPFGNNSAHWNVMRSKSGVRNLCMLGAFCLFLSAVEYMIPKPLPFMRIGLANLPLMLAIFLFPLRAYLILICIKVFGQALITGTLFSYIFIFSLTGTFLSALLMFVLSRMFGRQRSSSGISFIGIGTAGAFVSNLSQLALAYFFIFKENVRYIAPPFLLAGLVTGIVLGAFCEIFAGKSQWFKAMKNKKLEIWNY